jgi:hypothetical protein
MAQNPKVSSRQMVHVLRKHGIIRSREWIRINRC